MICIVDEKISNEYVEARKRFYPRVQLQTVDLHSRLRGTRRAFVSSHSIALFCHILVQSAAQPAGQRTDLPPIDGKTGNADNRHHFE